MSSRSWDGRHRHKETRGQVLPVALSAMRCDWPSIDIDERAADGDLSSRPLTEEEGRLIYVNGHTFTYVEADFPPDGEEVEGMDAGEEAGIDDGSEGDGGQCLAAVVGTMLSLIQP